jgi:2-polyprenyl-3-methyl-5-hydroxy-6-metoxy-1,4-benzoquinol methylase
MPTDFSTLTADDAQARYGREREAHNKYFSEDTRHSVDKFYSVVGASRRHYERMLLARSAGGRALEYGCGTGSHGVFLATHGAAHVNGIDISDVAIDRARADAARRSVHNLEHTVMNAESLSFASDSFDLICGTASARSPSWRARCGAPGPASSSNRSVTTRSSISIAA